MSLILTALVVAQLSSPSGCEWQLSPRGRALQCFSEDKSALIAFQCPFQNSPITRIAIVFPLGSAGGPDAYFRGDAGGTVRVQVSTESGRSVAVATAMIKDQLAEIQKIINVSKDYIEITRVGGSPYRGFSLPKVQAALREAHATCSLGYL